MLMSSLASGHNLKTNKQKNNTLTFVVKENESVAVSNEMVDDNNMCRLQVKSHILLLLK